MDCPICDQPNADRPTLSGRDRILFHCMRDGQFAVSRTVWSKFMALTQAHRRDALAHARARINPAGPAVIDAFDV